MENLLKQAGFKPLGSQDRPLYQKYFNGPVLDLCFSALTAYWTAIFYKEYSGCLCLIMREEGRYFALAPMGQGNAREAVAKLCELFSRAGLKARFEYIPAGNLELFKDFKLGFDARFSDCVLPAEQLLRLSWKFKHKTADYNHFIRTVPGAAVHPFDKAHFSLFIEALNGWCLKRDCAQCLFGCEKDVLKKYIENAPFNGACGIAVTDCGRPIGCLVGERSNHYLYYCLGKSLPQYSGLSVYMYVEFARREPAEWINLGSDGGMEGIRRFKDKFAPYTRLDKYWAEL